MKILAVIPASPRKDGDSQGVSFVHALREIQAIRLQGAEVEVHEVALRRNPLRVFPEWCRLRQALARVNPDLVHAHVGGPVGLLTLLATRRPRVITYRGSELNPCPQMTPLHWGVHWLCSQLAARLANGIVCVSRELRGRLWPTRRPIRVLPSGVDTAAFFPRDRQQARQRLGWEASERVVVFNAGLSPDVKRLDRAMAAMAKVPNARLEVMRGQVSPQEVPWLLNAGDCLLLTSDLEGSPTIVQEAVACGLPVVTVPVGDVAEVLQGVEPSWIVAPEPNALARAVRAALDQGGRSNGADKAHSISCARNAGELIKFYGSLL